MFSKTLREIYNIYHGIEVGMYSYGGCFFEEGIRPGTIIGRYCSFANKVYIYNGNHPIRHKSMHPFFYEPFLGYVETEMISRTRQSIGNDVWIGNNAIILPSVSTVGDGAVIGAGSVVTKNVPPFAIVAGNPARIIRYRFTDERIQEIKDSRWWDKEIWELAGELDTFLKPLE
jgi:virginiamycin A acetyltransferase